MKIKEFNNIKEFAEQKTINKLIYSNMTYQEKKELRDYIYHYLDEKQEKNKDLIWEFLNEPMDSEIYLYSTIILGSYARRK